MSNPEDGQRTIGLRSTKENLQAATGRGVKENSGPTIITKGNGLRVVLLGSGVLGIGALAFDSTEVSAQDEVAGIEESGGVLVQDNFDTGRLNQRVWDTSFASGAVEVATIEDNFALRVTGEQENYVSLGFLGEVDGANVLETRIRIADVGDGDGVISLNLMSKNPGHGSGYSALFSTEGGFLADRNGGFQMLESTQQNPFQLGVNQWHTVRLELTNGELKLSVDGRVVIVADAEERQTGRPVIIFDSGMEVFVGNVRVELANNGVVMAEPTDTPEPTTTVEATTTPEFEVVGTVTIGSGVNIRRSAQMDDNNVLFRTESSETFTAVRVITDGDEVNGNSTWYEILLPEGEEGAEPTATPTPSPTPTQSPTRIPRTARRGFVSATVVQFRPAPEATATQTVDLPTPTASPTNTPTIERTVVAQNSTPTPTEISPTPTTGSPEGTQVAALVGNQDDNLVMPSEMYTHETRLRFRSYMDLEFLNDAPWTSEYIDGTANWANMGLLRGEGGERVAAGIYTDPDTFPLDPGLFRDKIYINGVEIEQGLVIGQVVAIGRTGGDDPMTRSIVLYVAVPEEGTTDVNVLSFFVSGDVSRLLAVDAQGNYTGAPSAADANGYISRGINPNSTFVWDGNNGSPFQFPAGNGEIVRVTTQVPVAVFFAMNPGELGGHGEQAVNMSEDRNPDEWIADWRNGNTDQDEEVRIYPVGIVFPTNVTTAATNTP
jgi:hypothetical protein